MSQAPHLQTLHPLDRYTTLKIGGKARYFCEIFSLHDYLEVLNFSQKVNLPLFILGRGSNTLFVDEVFEAIVVVNKIQHLQWDLPEVICGAGYNISLLAVKASRQGYSGLEGASGIPASVGGAIFMNAGSGLWETQSSLLWVKTINNRGEVSFKNKTDLSFSYRHSSFHENGDFIIEAAFKLNASDIAWDLQQSIIKKRIATQPYKQPSAGCFFKNPEGLSAGALIDKAGLKGLEHRGAAVSTIHANFLINHSNATATDLLELSRRVQQEVLEKTGVKLEQEVRLVGNFLYEKI
jgi:UDP-N-acetylmuramate dehydrogenase